MCAGGQRSFARASDVHKKNACFWGRSALHMVWSKVHEKSCSATAQHRISSSQIHCCCRNVVPLGSSPHSFPSSTDVKKKKTGYIIRRRRNSSERDLNLFASRTKIVSPYEAVVLSADRIRSTIVPRERIHNREGGSVPIHGSVNIA